MIDRSSADRTPSRTPIPPCARNDLSRNRPSIFSRSIDIANGSCCPRTSTCPLSVAGQSGSRASDLTLFRSRLAANTGRPCQLYSARPTTDPPSTLPLAILTLAWRRLPPPPTVNCPAGSPAVLSCSVPSIAQSSSDPDTVNLPRRLAILGSASANGHCALFQSTLPSIVAEARSTLAPSVADASLPSTLTVASTVNAFIPP